MKSYVRRAAGCTLGKGYHIYGVHHLLFKSIDEVSVDVSKGQALVPQKLLQVSFPLTSSGLPAQQLFVQAPVSGSTKSCKPRPRGGG